MADPISMRTSHPAGIGEGQHKGSIVIVDDNPKNLKLLERMLSDSGYHVRLFAEGKLAIAAAVKCPPDIFLLDVLMPEMDGYELCEILKTEPTLTEIPVVFLSALYDTADKVRAFQAGGVDYITKPFQVDEVRARIETHIGLRCQKRLLQESYDRLQRLEIMRDNLTHMIVHDMRTPLTIILGSLEILEQVEKPNLSPSAWGRLAKAKKSTTTLIEFVNSLLDISKFESGKMAITPSEFDIVDLVSQGVAQFEAASIKHKFSLEAPSEKIMISADRSLVVRVVQNLVGNAVKFAPHETEIEVVVSRDKDTVRVAVHDDGPGIAPEHRERVFDKFYQVSRHDSSTGLGLTFCKMAVEAHHGRIGIDDDSAKQNSMWFSLPTSYLEESARTTIEPPLQPPSSQSIPNGS